jgi:hypothetical protein
VGLNTTNKAALMATGIKIGIPILVVGLGVVIIKKMFNRNADGTSSSGAPSLKDTVINKQNLSISVSDAALFANTLYGAMLDFGTDEKTIYSTINKIQSKDDMLLVIKAFGMKQYLWGTRAALIGQNYNLIGWLKFELSDGDISKIKSKFDQWGIPL